MKAEYERAVYLADIEELSYKKIGKILGKTLPLYKEDNIYKLLGESEGKFKEENSHVFLDRFGENID